MKPAPHYAGLLAAALLAAAPATGQPAIRDHGTAGELRVLFFGDAGTGGRAQYETGRTMHQVCQRQGCDLALVLGDNIYDAGVTGVDDPKFHSHFELPYEAFGRFDFWLVPGNHDWRGNVAAQIAYTDLSPRWRQPAAHFVVPALPAWVQIYGFDTQNISAAQADAARPFFCGSAATWKIAFGHHPIHAHGRHEGNVETAAVLLPLFEECGVQLYLSGHEHHLEHITARHFDQVVSGAAATTRRVKHRPYQPGDASRQNFARASLGFGTLHLTPGSLDLVFHDRHGGEIYRWATTPGRHGLDRAAAN